MTLERDRDRKGKRSAKKKESRYLAIKGEEREEVASMQAYTKRMLEKDPKLRAEKLQTEKDYIEREARLKREKLPRPTITEYPRKAGGGITMRRWEFVSLHRTKAAAEKRGKKLKYDNQLYNRFERLSKIVPWKKKPGFKYALYAQGFPTDREMEVLKKEKADNVLAVKLRKVKKRYPKSKRWDRGPEPKYPKHPLSVATVGTASAAERQAAIVEKHGRTTKIYITPNGNYDVRAGPPTRKSKQDLQNVRKQRKHLAEHGAVEWGAGPEKAKDYADYYTLLRLEKGAGSLTDREQYPHDFRGRSKKKKSFEDIPGYYDEDDVERG